MKTWCLFLMMVLGSTPALAYNSGPLSATLPLMYLVAIGLVLYTGLKAMRRGAAFTALLVAAAVVLATSASFADTVAAPETVAQATGETTKVTWAYGAAISQWASALGTLVFAAVMFALRQLPGQVYAILVSMRADQLLQKAIDYGINAVQGATKDKVLEVNVGNKVLAYAVQYVLDNAPKWLQDWMGGPEQIVKKIFARLNLDAAAAAPAPAAVVAEAKTTG